MSCIYKGEVIETDLSKNSKGGTEMMRQRLIDTVDKELLKGYAIHLSRPREIYDDVKNILWCHDLAEDPENNILKDSGWERFDHFVFVTAWQRDQYIAYYGIPYSKCSVIRNAVEKRYDPKEKDMSTIRFIYHTTPHRGLDLLYPVFDALTQDYDNIHLDVFSSFRIYGWENRDRPFNELFNKISNHDHMSYHGCESNDKVLEALDKAHIFLYPNIWKETSCIALIEAIKSQLICIHPNFGALTETAGGATIMYDYHEDYTAHANIAYGYTKSVLEHIKLDPNFFSRFTISDRYSLAVNDINTFTSTWAKLLREKYE